MKIPTSAAASFCGLIVVVNSAFAQTWTQTGAPSMSWGTIAMSADGRETDASTNGHIYMLKTIAAPQVNITPINDSFKLSWLVPSRNFVLQQSTDLSAWTDVTNSPVLNFTNLNDEVTVPPASGCGFYRLVTQ